MNVYSTSVSRSPRLRRLSSFVLVPDRNIYYRTGVSDSKPPRATFDSGNQPAGHTIGMAVRPNLGRPEWCQKLPPASRERSQFEETGTSPSTVNYCVSDVNFMCSANHEFVDFRISLLREITLYRENRRIMCQQCTQIASDHLKHRETEYPFE